MIKAYSKYLLVLLVFLLSGCVSSVGTSKVSSKKSRIIFEVPASVNSEKVSESLFEAVNLRVNDLQTNENFLPEQLPAQPEGPKSSGSAISSQLQGLAAMAGGSPALEMMNLNTTNAYYTVSGQGGSSSSFNKQEEYYKAAVYPYKDGYKIYLYLFYKEGTNGIVGALAKSALASVVGNEGSLLYMAQVRDKFIKFIPEAKIISQSPSKLNQVVLNGATKGY